MARNKKQKGSMDSLIYAVVIIAILAVFTIALIPCFGLLQTKSTINQIARKYILEMEIEGMLSSQNEAALIAELNEINGVKRVQINPATTRTIVGYGEIITLNFEVDYQHELYDVSNILAPSVSESTSTVIYNKQSTAKY